MDDRVFVLAHRGYHQQGVRENSVEAMAAANQRADGVEFDVRQTRDGVLVLNHDADAFALSIEGTEYSTLREVSQTAGAIIPTLEEAIAVIEPEKFVFAHVKVGGIAARVVEICHPRFGERFRVGSFRFSHVAAAPKELRWLITYHALQAFPYRRQIRGIDYRYGGGWIRRWGLEPAAWTVISADQTDRLLRFGTRFFTTDDPEKVRASIAAWKP